MKVKSESPVAAHQANWYFRVANAPLFVPILLVTVLIWEGVSLCYEASKRHFWYDELLTSHLSALQPFSYFWQALKAGADGMPLGYYVFARTARLLPADPHISLRLPSILGYLLTLLGAYWFVRKRLPGIAGIAAVVLIALSPFREYALEARGYALLVGFLAIGAVVWQNIGEKRFMIPLLAILLMLAVSSHPLAVVTLSAFALAELTWTLSYRRIRWGVWVTFAVGTIPFLLSYPILLHYRTVFGKHFWAQPGWGSAISSYGFYLGTEDTTALIFLVLFGMVVGRLLFSHQRRRGEQLSGQRGFGISELALISGFLYYPVLLLLLTKLQHSGYTARYAWPAIFGLIVGAIYLLKNAWIDESISGSILVALLVAFLFSDARNFYHAHATRPDDRWTRLAEIGNRQPEIPIVIASPQLYLEATEYAPTEMRNRLVEVVDPEAALQIIGTDTPDETNLVLGKFVPLRIQDRALFEAGHPNFILVAGSKNDWFTQYLIQNKYNLKLLLTDLATRPEQGSEQVYDAQR